MSENKDSQKNKKLLKGRYFNYNGSKKYLITIFRNLIYFFIDEI